MNYVDKRAELQKKALNINSVDEAVSFIENLHEATVGTSVVNDNAFVYINALSGFLADYKYNEDVGVPGLRHICVIILEGLYYE